MRLPALWLALGSLLLLATRCASAGTGPAVPQSPNLVVILADDLGYGDVAATNPGSRLKTPNLDRLVGEGRVYTDAHSPSAVCTPTRYTLLTGRYSWRTRLKSGVLWGQSPSLIQPGRATIASYLRENGYVTGCIGKWHLGLDYARNADESIDFSEPIGGGPLAHGFDEFFGIPASLDMPPYYYVQDDRARTPPTLDQEGVGFPGFVRKGKRAADLEFDRVLGELAGEAEDFIGRHAADERPFFLYLPLTGPHKPVSPSPGFLGRSGLGPYGDFVQEVDATVGRVLAALDASGVAENTLVVVTSDNGSFMYAYEDREDHTEDAGVQGYRRANHRANGPLRGTKADIWEAGHRVPYIVRWPGRVPAGTTSDTTICHVDLFATLASIAGHPVGLEAAQDSFDLSDDYRGGECERGPVVHHSGSGMFALRQGRYKLVAGSGSGGREKPRGKPFEKPYVLFDLSQDLSETNDLIESRPEVAQAMEELLERIRRSEGSRPGLLVGPDL